MDPTHGYLPEESRGTLSDESDFNQELDIIGALEEKEVYTYYQNQCLVHN